MAHGAAGIAAFNATERMAEGFAKVVNAAQNSGALTQLSSAITSLDKVASNVTSNLIRNTNALARAAGGGDPRNAPVNQPTQQEREAYERFQRNMPGQNY